MGGINLDKIVDMRTVDWTMPISGSSEGILPKTIIVRNGVKFYIKLGSYSESYGFYGIEPLIELINSRIGKLLGIPVLDYTLIRCLTIMDGRQIETLASLSKDYKDDNMTSISLEKWYRVFRNKGESVLGALKRAGLQDEIYKQFIFDYIIMNLDRHGKNNEILFSNNLRLAPFFDNSLTYITNRPSNDIENKREYNDMSRVNNYIGTMNLRDNLGLIDRDITIRSIRESDRQKLFQGVSKVTTRQFRNYVWYMLNRRVQNVAEQNIQFIHWK